MFKLVDQLRAGDEVESQIIFDLGAVHCLSAQVLGHQQGFHLQGGGIDRRGQAGGAAADDNQIVCSAGASPIPQEFIPGNPPNKNSKLRHHIPL